MSLLERVSAVEAELKSAQARTADEVEQFRVAMLGRNGTVTTLFEEFKQVAAEEKRALGQRMNQLKQLAQQRLDELKGGLESTGSASGPVLDLSAPALTGATGSLHPLTIVRQRIVDIFTRIGYTVSQGPEVEDDRHNFSALNFPPDHPARDMQDTFFVGSERSGVVLRTQTSPIQLRAMLARDLPIYVVAPGRVFRTDELDATHTPVFHQIEGLAVDEGITMADLKGTLEHLAAAMFGEGVQIRLRPSYFPFTEPSAELDLQCFVCRGASVGNPEAPCRTCSSEGWIEWGGCGMVNPRVLRAAGIDTARYSGFAFGMGVERTLMFRHGVTDMRDMVEGDIRFSRAFGVEV